MTCLAVREQLERSDLVIDALPTLLLLALLVPGPRPQAPQPNWDAWKFLIGQWTGEGSGQPGQGSGDFTFHLDLDGKILVRESHSDYPATKDHPATSHRDLMVVYPGGNGKPDRAIYFDNEGHVIDYTVEFTSDGSAVFLSVPQASAPRFRLTYIRLENDRVRIRFEMAPLGHPEGFSTYVEGVCRRTKP